MSNGKDDVDFGVLLNLAFASFKEQLDAHLAGNGFDDLGPSFGYVFRLLQSGSFNLRQVADQLQITPQGALKIVNDMIAKGYVKRKEPGGADARVKPLVLTPRGKQAVTAARAYHARYEKALASRFGARAIATVREVLTHTAQVEHAAVRRPRPV